MAEKPRIGIIGIGMVGGQVMRWFKDEDGANRIQDLFCYDKLKKEYRDDISEADIIFVCVPTPSKPSGACDISIVESVIRDLPDRINKQRMIVIKSTVTPGTTCYLQKRYKDKGLFFFNPEFLTELKAWENFIEPDTQIVAPAYSHDEEAWRQAEVILNLLPNAPFQSPSDEWYINSTEAELGKYDRNIFGTTKVVLSTISALRCKIFGADYKNVRQVWTSDERIGQFWTEVPYDGYWGYGGFCFEKDTNASIASDEKLLGTLTEDDFEKIVFSQSIEFFRVMRLFNRLLLKSQGLTPEDVSIHTDELRKKLEDKNA